MASKTLTCFISTALVLASASMIYAAQVLFTPSLTLSEEYTDNLFLTPDNEIDDYITTAGLGLSGQVLWRTAGLELNYSPSYIMHADNDDNDSWRHAASLSAWKTIKENTRYELRNTYLRTSDPTDESEALDEEDPTQGPVIETDANRRGRREYYTNIATARVSHQFGSNDRFYLAYQYSILRDEEIPAGQTASDNDISTPSAGLTYNFTPRWGMTLDTSYAVSDYEEENDRDEFNGNIRLLHNFSRTFSGFLAYRHTTLDFNEETDEDYQISRPSIGFAIAFEEHAGMSIDAGYYVQDFETSEDEEGFNIGSEIYKRWEYRTGYFGITGESGYEIDDNGSEDNGLTIYYAGGVRAGYRFSPRLSSIIHCSYRYADFPNETPERVDTTLEAGAELDWQALQWMVIGLTYNYSNVSSDDPANEYTENSAMISIRLTPTSPYRLN